VENRVKTIRRRFFTPMPKFATLVDLNDWLRQQCLAYVRTQRHPEHAGQSVWEAFERERSHLLQLSRFFDGYAESIARVSTVSLVNFDRNRYSVDCREIGQAVQVRSGRDIAANPQLSPGVLAGEGESETIHGRVVGGWQVPAENHRRCQNLAEGVVERTIHRRQRIYGPRDDPDLRRWSTCCFLFHLREGTPTPAGVNPQHPTWQRGRGGECRRSGIRKACRR
jgi:hypothetical protein